MSQFHAQAIVKRHPNCYHINGLLSRLKFIAWIDFKWADDSCQDNKVSKATYKWFILFNVQDKEKSCYSSTLLQNTLTDLYI